MCQFACMYVAMYWLLCICLISYHRIHMCTITGTIITVTFSKSRRNEIPYGVDFQTTLLLALNSRQVWIATVESNWKENLLMQTPDWFSVWVWANEKNNKFHIPYSAYTLYIHQMSPERKKETFENLRFAKNTCEREIHRKSLLLLLLESWVHKLFCLCTSGLPSYTRLRSICMRDSRRPNLNFF